MTDPDTTPDPRPQFAAAVATTGTVVAGVRPEQLDLASGCGSFTVRELGGHLLCVLGRAGALARGEDIFTVPDVVPQADDAWAASWADWAATAQAAWADAATLETDYTVPWATAPGWAMLAAYLNEVIVHGWDLARATGQSAHWDDDAITYADGAIRAMLPPGDRLAAFAEMTKQAIATVDPRAVPFGAEVLVSPDAPAIDRLVAYTGRQP